MSSLCALLKVALSLGSWGASNTIGEVGLQEMGDGRAHLQGVRGARATGKQQRRNR